MNTPDDPQMEYPPFQRSSIWSDRQTREQRTHDMHRETCRRAAAQREQEIAAWQKQWPHHCQACRGRGIFESWYDPSPAGVSLSAGRMQDVEPCEECTLRCVCPRCGSENALDEDGNGPCAICTFNFDDGCPEPWECCCYEDEPYFSTSMEALGGNHG